MYQRQLSKEGLQQVGAHPGRRRSARAGAAAPSEASWRGGGGCGRLHPPALPRPPAPALPTAPPAGALQVVDSRGGKGGGGAGPNLMSMEELRDLFSYDPGVR